MRQHLIQLHRILTDRLDVDAVVERLWDSLGRCDEDAEVNAR